METGARGSPATWHGTQRPTYSTPPSTKAPMALPLLLPLAPHLPRTFPAMGLPLGTPQPLMAQGQEGHGALRGGQGRPLRW